MKPMQTVIDFAKLFQRAVVALESIAETSRVHLGLAMACGGIICNQCSPYDPKLGYRPKSVFGYAPDYVCPVCNTNLLRKL
jgi:transposase-like protein